MENEITFRTSVGGYRRDEVIEYVESMNEQIFCLKKESEEAAANYKARIHELETLLVQKEANEATLIEENGAKLEEYETEKLPCLQDLKRHLRFQALSSFHRPCAGRPLCLPFSFKYSGSGKNCCFPYLLLFCKKHTDCCAGLYFAKIFPAAFHL